MYEVWFENGNGAELEKVFNVREEAEAYLEDQEELLSCEEDMYIIEVEE
jgi:hypothetical protein